MQGSKRALLHSAADPASLTGIAVLILMQDERISREEAYRIVMVNWPKVGPIDLTDPTAIGKLLKMESRK